jgi:hypothetical protein
MKEYVVSKVQCTVHAMDVPCAREADSMGLQDLLRAEERDESRQRWSEMLSIRGVLQLVRDGCALQL